MDTNDSNSQTRLCPTDLRHTKRPRIHAPPMRCNACRHSVSQSRVADVYFFQHQLAIICRDCLSRFVKIAKYLQKESHWIHDHVDILVTKYQLSQSLGHIV